MSTIPENDVAIRPICHKYLYPRNGTLHRYTNDYSSLSRSAINQFVALFFTWQE